MVHRDVLQQGLKVLGALATCLLVVIGAAGCTGSVSTDELPELLVRTQEYYFDAPASAPGGLTRVTVENAGTEPHQLELIRLNDGVEISDLLDLLAAFEPGASSQDRQEASYAYNNEIGTYHGGPNEVPPGERRTVVTQLPPGRYAMVCYVNTDGEMHVMKGMIGAIEIRAPESEPHWMEPDDAVQVTLDDFEIDVAGDLRPGTQVVKVTNAGTQPHELRAFRGLEGAGGSSSISPGMSTWVELVLDEGRYTFVCYVPDSDSGRDHSRLGMRTTVTVE